MTSSIRIDWHNGSVSLEHLAITLDSNGGLDSAVQAICLRPELLSSGVTRYRLARKVSVCGFVADCVIDILQGKLSCIALLFDVIQFFDQTILESKVVKAIEKKSGLHAVSAHPSSACLDPCPWGKAEFSYDPRQGDLSLVLSFD